MMPMAPQCRCVGESAILYNGLKIAGRMPPFTRQMRDAIRAGRKTQTRRPMAPQPTLPDGPHRQAGAPNTFGWLGEDDGTRIPYELRTCRIGNLRVMSEPLKCGADGLAYYADDGALVVSLRTGAPIPWRWQRSTLSSIHMPTEAGRTVRRYTDIRAEQLQEISGRDICAEGVHVDFTIPGAFDALDQFAKLWNSVYANSDCNWDANPWVWVLVFEEVSCS